MEEAITPTQDINYQPETKGFNFKAPAKYRHKKGLFIILLLAIIAFTSIAVLYLNSGQNIFVIGNKNGNSSYKINQKYVDYAKKYLGPARLDPRRNQYSVSGLFDGHNNTNINVDTASGPLVFEINQDTLIQKMAIYQNNSTDSATLKLDNVYTTKDFIKNVPDGGLLQIFYKIENNINTAVEINYIK